MSIGSYKNTNIYDALRVELASRKDFSKGIGNVLICPICGQPIKHGFDIHEALITRAMVVGNSNSELIFSRYNCIARHHICPDGQYHQPGNDDWDTYKKIVRYLVHHERRSKVTEWFEGMLLLYRSSVIKNAYLKFLKADTEICEMLAAEFKRVLEENP